VSKKRTVTKEKLERVWKEKRIVMFGVSIPSLSSEKLTINCEQQPNPDPSDE
jgi:hypothetical protein